MSFQVANDEIGGTVLSELEEAGIDVSHVIVRLELRLNYFIMCMQVTIWS